MNIAQKLKTIQTLSGLSQEKLARKFAVSFATLNSWINGKSIPRQKARQQIEEMYLDITGQKFIPADELAAKKQMVEKKQQEHPGVLNTLLENPDIDGQFILSLTYHTNRIEGSTLSEPETEAILFHNVVIPNKSLIEHLEVKNHQTALEYLFRHTAAGSGGIDETLILNLHRILMNGILPDAGAYRRHSVRIVGADVPTANYVKVPFLMAELIDAVNAGVRDTVSHIAGIHSRLEQIHPFADGNGRIGRLIIHAMALQKKLPPAVICQEKKRFYYSYLQRAQQTRHEDLSLLEDFICDAFLEGFRIMERA
jgi:Fic family protein/DNA-binding XRE family transcriptional regulator